MLGEATGMSGDTSTEGRQTSPFCLFSFAHQASDTDIVIEVLGL